MKIFLFPLAWAFSYILAAFVQANFNIAEWSMDARFLCALLLAGLTGIVCIVNYGPK